MPEKIIWAFFYATTIYIMVHLWIWHIRTVIYAAQLHRWNGE